VLAYRELGFTGKPWGPVTGKMPAWLPQKTLVGREFNDKR